MTEQNNADLIAETREGFRLAVANGWAREGDAPSLAMRLADALEVTEKDRRYEAEQKIKLAAVVEKVTSTVNRYETTYGGMRQMQYIIGDVRKDVATVPDDLLREVKAEAWDEGAGDMAEHIDNGAWWEIQNPYRQKRDEQS